MRVTVTIDDGVGSVRGAASTEVTYPDSEASVPADLAATAAAIGAISAGPAPTRLLGSGDAGAPGISDPPSEGASSIDSPQSATDATSAGAAPGQLDLTDTADDES